MAAAASTFTDADLAYLRASFRRLDELCAERGDSVEVVRRLIAERRLPRPSYVLDDGTELVPPDYFVLVDAAGGPEGLRDEYERLYRAAIAEYGLPFDLELFERRWESYLDGISGICMREVTPRTIVRKRMLIDDIERLLAAPRPDDPSWTTQLRERVDELDSIEKEFAPDYDRGHFVPTRDTYIRDVRRAYPRLGSPGPA
jgi:hypothetical protein